MERATITAPDVVVLDHEMPQCTGLEALPRLRTGSPESKILMFSSGPEPETEKEAMARGAHAYRSKFEGFAGLSDSIVSLAQL